MGCLSPNYIHVCSLEKWSSAIHTFMICYSGLRMRHISMFWLSSYANLALALVQQEEDAARYLSVRIEHVWFDRNKTGRHD